MNKLRQRLTGDADDIVFPGTLHSDATLYASLEAFCGGKGGTYGPCPGSGAGKPDSAGKQAANAKANALWDKWQAASPDEKNAIWKQWQAARNEADAPASASAGKAAAAAPAARPKATPAASSLDATTANLTPEQTAALKQYSGNDYALINEGLRAGKVSPEYAATVAHMDAAMANAPAIPPPPATGYRGVKLSGAAGRAFQANMQAALKNGTGISTPGFTSTSTDATQAGKFVDVTGAGKNDTLARMEIKTSHGISLDKLSTTPGEKELLLGRNAQLKVTGYRTETGVNKHGEPITTHVYTMEHVHHG